MTFALVFLLGITTPLPAGGTYHYAEIVSGKTVATETLRVQWSGTTVHVWESRIPTNSDGIYVDSEAVYDAITLSLASYRSAVTQGCGGLQYTVGVRGSQVRSNDKTIDFAGASRFVLSDDVAMPFFLAAQTRLWQNGDPIAIDPAHATGHPATAPLHLDYDPASNVIAEVETASVTWKRIPG
ncbi:MAG: hypothetical protein JO277_09885 [Candidatus Eremiobacteraeota bacterium]|nr:hypothetical protein [Candidatus Eremiobacteraeota bacterium]